MTSSKMIVGQFTLVRLYQLRADGLGDLSVANAVAGAKPNSQTVI